MSGREAVMWWGAVVVSVIVTAGFLADCILILFHEVPPGSQRAADTLFGFLGAAFGVVVGFWTGPMLTGTRPHGDEP